MKKYSLLLGMTFAAFLTGCTDDNFGNQVQNPVQVGDDILFGTSISGDADVNGTRTVYGDRTDTGIPVYWKEEGDSVAIFCPQASAPASKLVTYLVTPAKDAQGKPTNGSASVTAQVKPGEAGLQWGTAPTHRFYAFYPAKSVKGTEDDGKIMSNIPVEQNVKEWRLNQEIDGTKTHFGLPNMDFAYMYACDSVTTAEIDKNDAINLKFHNLLTVLDITLPGPEQGQDSITVTAINVEATGDQHPILTGDFYCYLRPGIEGHKVGDCEPVNPNSGMVSNRIAISTYNPATKKFIKLGPGEQINVKAYILPHSEEQIEKNQLTISVVTMNGAPKKKMLQKRTIEPGKINRVRLPHLEQSNETNYWMSNLDPNVFFTEISFPGSHQSVGWETQSGLGWKYDQYQNSDLSTQFKDGIRAFSFQTTYKSDNILGGDNKIRVFASGNEKDELYVYLKQIANELQLAKDKGKSDFALVSIVFKSNGSNTNANNWFKRLADELNNNSNYNSLPIYDQGITANTTIGELANKIVLRIDRPGTDYVPALMSEQPETTTPKEKPMYWGSTNNTSVLTMYAHDGTSIDHDGNNEGEMGSLDEKMGYINTIFTKSVDMYHNNEAHNYFYHTNIGGFYCVPRIIENSEGGNTIDYTSEIMPRVVDELQKRGEDASLGVVLMNFADKQAGSGAKYGCDGLIQTIIYNNFSFALRKKPVTTTSARSEYVTRMSSDENQWDE